MVAVVVPDYDEAIAHYTQAWGFELLEDSVRTPEKRWVRVAPPGSPCALLLAKAATPRPRSRHWAADRRARLSLYVL